MNRLPVLHYEPCGLGYFYDYWLNFCDHNEPHYISLARGRSLEQDWNGRYCYAKYTGDAGDADCIEFKTPEDLTMFLLRWS